MRSLVVAIHWSWEMFDTVPHAFFDTMTLMVAASLLLAIAAVARTVWRRARPAEAMKLGVGHSSVSSRWADSLLLLASLDESHVWRFRRQAGGLRQFRLVRSTSVQTHHEATVAGPHSFCSDRC